MVVLILDARSGVVVIGTERYGLCLGVPVVVEPTTLLVLSGDGVLGCVSAVSDNLGELPRLGETVTVVLILDLRSGVVVILDLRSGVVGFEAVAPGLWEKDEKTADGTSSSRSSSAPNEECLDGDRLGVENAEDRAGDKWKESPADGALISGETSGNSGSSAISADTSISN